MGCKQEEIDFFCMVQFCYVLIYLFCFNVIVLVIDVVETFANSENRDSVDLLGQNDSFIVLSFFVVVAANSCLLYAVFWHPQIQAFATSSVWFSFVCNKLMICSFCQLPHCNNHLAMFVEPYGSYCGHICTAR